MNAITAIMLVFSVIGAIDRILDNKFGLGKEFEKGFELFGSLALSMIGMIVLSPIIADALSSAGQWVYDKLRLDPSMIPALLFANDLGGAALATELAVDSEVGRLNGLVVSAMMGLTISFTIPFALTAVKKEQHESLLMGLLCGIITIPIGCFVAGLIQGISLLPLLGNMLPLFLFSIVLAVGLLYFPKVCTRVFGILGQGIKILITIGLALGIIQYLSGKELIPNLNTLEYAGSICLSAAVVMTGAFPLLCVFTRLLKKQLKAFGDKLGVNDTSAAGFISCLANSITTFEMMGEMDDKGVMLNAAFAVSAAFLLGDHLAFTMAFDPGMMTGMMVGKIISGIAAVALACVVYTIRAKKES